MNTKVVEEVGPGGFSNWGRWDNNLGTLNFISEATSLKAAGLVRSGRAINCGRSLSADERVAPVPVESIQNNVGFEHQMTLASEFAPGRFAASDRIAFALHSFENTHLDALSHVAHQGFGFNGVPYDDLATMEDGAKVLTISDIPAIATRGVLIDVARRRGVDHLQRGECVTADDLADLVSIVEPGDCVLIRTGRWRSTPSYPSDEDRSQGSHGQWQGLHAECVDLMAALDVGLLGTDTVGDAYPSPAPGRPSVHMLSEVYLGMPLIHSMDLEELAQACATTERNTFLFCCAPLKIPNATGCPVAPICVL